MRVIVPYTKVLLEVELTLPTAEWVDVSGAEDAYWQLLSELWTAHETVIVVEHDIVPKADTLSQLIACPSEWCACGYAFEDFGLIYGLGCTKFEGSLMERIPKALDAVALFGDREHPPRHWCSLDALLQAALASGGAHCHHHGEVRHLSPRRSHDACRPARTMVS